MTASHVDETEAARPGKRSYRGRRLGALGVALGLLGLVLFFIFGPWGPLELGLFKHDATAANGGPGGPPRIASDQESPVIAIVVDDTGYDPANLDQWLSIDAPITFSVIPYCAYSSSLADRLADAGYQVMLHVPTVNEKPNSYAGQGQLDVGMDRDTVFRTLDADLAQVPHVAGFNNHEGGLGCNDLALMTLECQWAVDRGLFVVDSNSSTHSKVSQACADVGLPRRVNQVFIDHQNEPDYIRSAMHNLADIARKHGTAIGICHFHRPNTPAVVGEMIETLEAEGIHFAFVRDVGN